MLRKTKNSSIYILMIIIAVLQLFPLYWLVISAFKDNSEIIGGTVWALPTEWQLSNFTEAWVSAKVNQYFGNSVIVTLVTLLFVLLFASMMAYALTRMKFKYNSLILFILLMGVMVPIHATLIPLFMILKNLGILSSRLSIILPYIAVNLPIGVYMLSAFLRTMPKELEEAACMDGCGVVKSFFKVVLPLLKPPLASVAIFVFLAVWNELLMAATFIQKQELRTLPLGLMNFSGQYSISWGPLAAAMVISTLPILLAYVLFSDQMEKSFTAGAILK
ncbi:carbohydrate ABC transporter permease [Paenibacillus riograndensis]|uniref:ABC transporter inner membrane protein n=1 Tax=Paenibacillus riograndensis SBR5 TaxID=1073571 RepID=A0A0E4CUP1_9BACL|nr:carbohydrate ABC transporter permease [Paenibacillus riograndensis]CQR52519.1 ABC transporter inner membrane protein [Paenibacillus riograndensis SBR5]